MKIIQIGSFPLDAGHIKGGVEASVYGLAVEQTKTNELTVLDIPRCEIRNDYYEKQDGINVYRFYAVGRHNYSSIFRLKSVLSAIRKQKPDVCHIHSTSLFCFMLFLFLKLYRFPVFVTVHGLAHIEKQNLWRKQHSIRNLFKYITQSLTEFIFLSICPVVIVDTYYVAECIKKYRKQGKILKLPVCKVIPQGVNPVFFRIGNLAEKNSLLSVGAINKRKGHLFLIKAMKDVKNSIPDFSLCIVGVLSDSTYYQSMQKSIIENNLEDNIEIFPDASFEEIQALYERAEIFVLHSEEESQGIVFCEAMAAGKSIVATNAGGIPWIIKNNTNGLLSDFGDIDTFADNLINLMKNDSLRKKIEETNRIQAHKYDWKYISDEILNVYKTLNN